MLHFFRTVKDNDLPSKQGNVGTSIATIFFPFCHNVICIFVYCFVLYKKIQHSQYLPISKCFSSFLYFQMLHYSDVLRSALITVTETSIQAHQGGGGLRVTRRLGGGVRGLVAFTNVGRGQVLQSLTSIHLSKNIFFKCFGFFHIFFYFLAILLRKQPPDIEDSPASRHFQFTYYIRISINKSQLGE